MLFLTERTDVIDYIAPAVSTALQFVFKEPPLAFISNIFTLPFTGAVWLAILICVLACALFLYIACKWEASMGMVSAFDISIVTFSCGNSKLRHHLLPHTLKIIMTLGCRTSTKLHFSGDFEGFTDKI